MRFHLGILLAWSGGEVETGTALVEEARDLFIEAGETSRALLARNELGYLAAIRGDPGEHEATAREVLAAAESIGDRFVELQALCSLVWVLLFGGRVRECLPVIERALGIARKRANWYRISYLLGQQALRGGDARQLGEVRRAALQRVGPRISRIATRCSPTSR